MRLPRDVSGAELAAIVGEFSRPFSLPAEDFHLQLFGKNR